MRRWVVAAPLCTLFASAAAPALCQTDSSPVLSLDVASDERRRGLSWSDAQPVVRAAVALPVTYDLSVDATVVSLWGSDRHGRADAVVDMRASYGRQLGGWRLSTDATYHLFPGASDHGYGEIGVSAGYLLGPASIEVFSRYAPEQDAIGGDNLYLGTAVAVAMPGKPLTVSAHVGRSSGKVDDPFKAARLRPGGRYWDHGVALDFRKNRWSAGLRYADSSAGGDVDHAGAAVIGTVGVTF